MEPWKLHFIPYYNLRNLKAAQSCTCVSIIKGLTFSLYFKCFSVTSRKPRDDEKDGQAYRFVSRAEMEMDIKAGRYLEHGEYEGNLYGTKIDSILEVVQTGRTCILDVNPQVDHS